MSGPTRRVGRRAAPIVGVAIIGAVIAGAVIVTVVGSSGADAPVETSGTAAPIVVDETDGNETSGGSPGDGPFSPTAIGRWPDPPADHDPHLVSRPGSGPLVRGASIASVLYVNSIGRPTLIEVTSGDRVEVDIADDRDYERIAIGDGEVRSLVRRKNVPIAGPDAIVVHVHREPGPSPWLSPGRPGIHLCLAAGCDGALVGALVGVAGVRLLDATDDATGEDAAIADLLFGGSRSGRFVVTDTDHGSVELPAPTDGPVWLIPSAEP